MKKATRIILLFALTINYSMLVDSIPFRNVIYYGEWSVYNDFYPSCMDPKSITHINYAFVDMDKNGDLKTLLRICRFSSCYSSRIIWHELFCPICWCNRCFCCFKS